MGKSVQTCARFHPRTISLWTQQSLIVISRTESFCVQKDPEIQITPNQLSNLILRHSISFHYLSGTATFLQVRIHLIKRMQGKLSYLSKYGSFSGDKASKKAKKKKGKKKSKKREENATSLRDLDEDDAIHNSIGEDNMNDGEDEPLICIPEGLSTSNIDPRTMLHSATNQSSFIPVNDSDARKKAAGKSSSLRARNQRKNRYDSEEENISRAVPPKNRRRIESSSDSSSGHRKRRSTRRYDSEESDSDNELNSRKQSRRYNRRHSSISPSPEVRKKHHTSRQRHDSSSDEFERKSNEISSTDVISTTYRDSKTGLKVDMENRYKDVLLNHHKDQLQSIELNKGRVQKETEAELKRNREFVKTQTFARTIDDLDDETGIKNIIRAEDPMAMQAMQRVSDK